MVTIYNRDTNEYVASRNGKRGVLMTAYQSRAMKFADDIYARRFLNIVAIYSDRFVIKGVKGKQNGICRTSKYN